MFVIPFQISATEYSLFVALQDENLERMREYDPAEVTMRKVLEGSPKVSEGRTLRDIVIGYATTDDLERVSRLIQSGASSREVLKHLTRGFRFRPDAGDHDGPYIPVNPPGGRAA